jgi:hypothetical protein
MSFIRIWMFTHKGDYWREFVVNFLRHHFLQEYDPS